MENMLPYFIGAVLIIVFIIRLNHKKQKTSVDNFLKDAEQMQPIFLVKSVETKLQNLYGALYEGGIRPTVVNDVDTLVELATDRHLLINELEELEEAYTSKQISLNTYSEKLQELQLKADKL